MQRCNRLRRGVVPLLLALAAALPLVFLGSGTASAAGPEITITSGFLGDTLSIGGAGWSGGVSLYQCAQAVDSEETFWQWCDLSTEVQVTDPSPWTTAFDTKTVLGLWEPFPSGTENPWGNGTYDCEAWDATCTIVATEDWQTFASDDPSHAPGADVYGPLDKATVTGDTTDLTDGALLDVQSTGHRPDTPAMAYVCVSYGPAYPGGCDPIDGSERTIDGSGNYDATVSLPRWVWDDDPFGNAQWYDGVNGVSIVVVSAANLASERWAPPDSLITFRDESLEKNPQLFTVTQVLVNRSGRITVTGEIDCSQAVDEWGQGNYWAAVNVDWTARQPIGRKGVVTAHYTSVIMEWCSVPGVDGPYTWATHPPITSTDIWWVSPDSGGKFAGGWIQIDAQATGSVFSDAPGADQYMITGVTQWDGQATNATSGKGGGGHKK